MPYCPPVDFDKKHNRTEVVISTDSYFDNQATIKTDFHKMHAYSQKFFNSDTYYLSDGREMVYGESWLSKRYYLIADQFMTVFRQKAHIFSNGCDENFITANSLYFINKLLNIGVENIAFEITDDESILFTSKLSGSSVYCEVYFDNINGSNEIEVITNIYKGHNQIFTSTADFSRTLEGLNEVKKQFEEAANELVPARNLSETTTAAEPLPNYRTLQLAGF